MTEPAERAGSAVQGRDGDGRQVAGQRDRPPDRPDRDGGSRGNGVEHQPGLGPLPQLAADQADQHPLLGDGGDGEQM
jgi:hypothetical protein